MNKKSIIAYWKAQLEWINLVGTVFVISAVSLTGYLAIYKFYAPAHQSIQRETFEQTKSYQDGVIQEIYALQLTYQTASPEHKVAIASVIKHKLAGFPEDKLPSNLKTFVSTL